MTPDFDGGTTTYTASTANATNKVTAVAESGEADVEISNGVTAVKNGSSATWSNGENTLTVRVTNGETVKTYTVTVTKS